jgi:phosphotransferase system HPr (HPr) family protein
MPERSLREILPNPAPRSRLRTVLHDVWAKRILLTNWTRAYKKTKKKSARIKQDFHLVNSLGLQARPAAEFVRAANAFRSEIWIVKGGERFSARSIIEVLTADLNCGETATIEAEGPDADKAVARIIKLVRGFKDKDLTGSWGQRMCMEDDY